MRMYCMLGCSLAILLHLTTLEVKAQADVPVVLSREVEDYAREFRRVQSPTRLERNIEVLYQKGIVAGKKLLYHAGLSELSLLEKMDEEQLGATRRALPGIFLTREEVLQAVPDPESFLGFAVKWGDRADIAFFSTLRMSYSSPGWPLFIIPLTDYGGCRRLGSFVFSEIYGRWRAFQSRFPNRYQEQVRREIDMIEENILHPSACEGPREVAEAYREFIHSFPDAPVAEEIRRRISAIDDGTSKLRFNQAPQCCAS